MAPGKKLSSYLNLKENSFEKLGIFDPYVGIDANLFLDPALLRSIKVEEFKNSYKLITLHFGSVLTLLISSKKEGDIAWRSAVKKLIFRETKGISIGYGASRSDGNAIGPELAIKVARTAKEIIELGVKDTSIFELISLFEKGMGADRLSDMAISIIEENVYCYTDRMVNLLKLKNDQIIVAKNVRTGKFYKLIRDPLRSKPLLLLPQELLRDLPMALARDEIGYVVYFNEQLRNRLSSLIVKDAIEALSYLTKKDYREIFLTEEFAPQIVKAYKEHTPEKYDFASDPTGAVRWYKDGQSFANKYPIVIEKTQPSSLEDVSDIVRLMIGQFRRNIESNGLNELLYKEPISKLRPKNERYSQRLFYSVADTYCNANNVVLAREPNAGNGPVDFKIASDYSTQVLVEIKLSSGQVRSGFEKQLPEYAKNENANKSFLLIIRVTESSKQINDVVQMAEQRAKDGENVPEVIVIDAMPRPSASTRRAIRTK